MKLSFICSELNIPFEFEDFDIKALKPVPEAGPDELTYVGDKKHIRALSETAAGAVLISEKLKEHVPSSCVALLTEEAQLCMAKLSAHFAKPLVSDAGNNPVIGEGCTLMPNVHVGKNSTIGQRCTLMPGVYVGEGVEIGDDTVLYPNVTVYNDSKIGSRCILHAGVVIGGDGFGYAHTRDGRHVKIHHMGNCEIQDDVEIGANATVDRAVFGATVIRKGTKIDNLVMVAHNCDIGEHNILVSMTGISGSSSTGRNVVFGGQCATGGHVHVGDFAQIGGRGAVSKDIEGGKKYAGYPLMEYGKWLRLQANIQKLNQ